MKHLYSFLKPNGVSEKLFNKIFPDNFSVKIDRGKALLSVECDNSASDDVVFEEVQRELDRVSFFVGYEILGHKAGKELDNGLKVKYDAIAIKAYTIGSVPDKLKKQNWSQELETQLCLWRMANTKNIPYAAKINMFFQIIEVCHINVKDPGIFPMYADATEEPHPLTESKLLRHLVSHKKLSVGDSQLKKYCEFLKIPEGFHDPIKKEDVHKIIKRIGIIQKVAKKIINNKLTLDDE